MAISTIGLSLMPISQCVAWYWVRTTPMPALYSSVSEIAAFYCAWALYNRYRAGVKLELGHFSMGVAAVTAYFQNRIAAMIGGTLVLCNFLVVAPMLLQWDAKTLAEKFKQDTSPKGILWAYTFKCYFASQILLWSFVLYSFFTYP
jgi:hypothetical protein